MPRQRSLPPDRLKSLYACNHALRVFMGLWRREPVRPHCWPRSFLARTRALLAQLGVHRSVSGCHHFDHALRRTGICKGEREKILSLGHDCYFARVICMRRRVLVEDRHPRDFTPHLPHLSPPPIGRGTRQNAGPISRQRIIWQVCHLPACIASSHMYTRAQLANQPWAPRRDGDAPFHCSPRGRPAGPQYWPLDSQANSAFSGGA